MKIVIQQLGILLLRLADCDLPTADFF